LSQFAERSLNGEVHLILPELGETGKKLEDFDEAAIRELMKKEASKPLRSFWLVF
jgi:hypothetical protein